MPETPTAAADPAKRIPLPGQERYVSESDETGLGAVDAVSDESAPSSMWGEAWKVLRRQPLFWAASLLIVGAVLLALFPDLFTGTDPRLCLLSDSLGAAAPDHPFGFDKQGCDIFARTVYGARASVSVGVLTTILVVVVGSLVGAIAGYFGGWFDSLLSRVTDIFFAIPFMLAAIVVMSMFKSQRSILTVVLVLGVFGWPQIARITRGAVMEVKNEEFVTASIALGAGRWATLARHILPNAAAPIIVTATVSLGSYIVAEATMSFLGIGLPDGTVSWGADISTAKESFRDAPHILFYPAGALALTVLGFIMMGDAVRDALDPKTRKQ